MICPGCYDEVTGELCPACGESPLLDGKLALLEPLSKDHPNVFRGRLAGEEVAVKALDVGGLRDWRDHDRFAAQTEILDLLRELPVPRALGDFARRGRIFHCQTLLRGAPLGNARPVEEIERLAEDLLVLLGKVHERGVVHRDLKPEHVLIGDEVQLIDFGAARLIHDAEPRVEPTVVGTPGYMAPEQADGDARVESDLFAAGKILQAALGERPATKKLAGLIRKLTHPDWRKRPHSAGEALRILHARPRAQWAWLSLPLVFGGVLAVWHPVMPAQLPPAAVVSEPVPDEDLETPARALLAEWEAAQNAHDFARYSALYAERFSGTKRSAGGKSSVLGRADWLADRKKMLKPSLQVAVDELSVSSDSRGATLSFVQRFRNGTYSDHGHKQIVVEKSGAALQIVSEAMLDSVPGWDEAEYRRLFAAHGATCETAFDPSDKKWLITLGRYEGYVETLRAADKARHRGVDVEIVQGEDFVELKDGYWLLAGASDDDDEADEISRRVHGRVRHGRQTTPKFPSVLRFAEERHMGSSAELITVVGNTAYVVWDHEARAYKLEGDQLSLQYSVPVPGRPVRVAVREGHPYVLDDGGHWSLIAESGVTPTRSFDPESEGRVAVFGRHRFEIEGDELAYRLGEQETYRIPLLTDKAGLWRIGDDRLLLFRPTDLQHPDLFLFAVGAAPVRLTKVCGVIDGELTEPAHVTIGAIDLDTDREGGFEIWSSQWGFYAPSLEADPVCPEEGGCYPSPYQYIDDEVSLLGRSKLEVKAKAGCECEGGC